MILNIFYGHSPSSADSKRVVCQLKGKVCARSTGYLLSQACPGTLVLLVEMLLMFETLEHLA